MGGPPKTSGAVTRPRRLTCGPWRPPWPWATSCQRGCRAVHRGGAGDTAADRADGRPASGGGASGGSGPARAPADERAGACAASGAAAVPHARRPPDRYRRRPFLRLLEPDQASSAMSWPTSWPTSSPTRPPPQGPSVRPAPHPSTLSLSNGPPAPGAVRRPAPHAHRRILPPPPIPPLHPPAPDPTPS